MALGVVGGVDDDERPLTAGPATERDRPAGACDELDLAAPLPAPDLLGDVAQPRDERVEARPPGRGRYRCLLICVLPTVAALKRRPTRSHLRCA